MPVFLVVALIATVGGCAAVNRPANPAVGTNATLPTAGLTTAGDPRNPNSASDGPDDSSQAAASDAVHADEVNGLIMRLFNEDDAVRIDGARELAAMGRHAGPAVPYLRDCARQDDGDSAGECAAAADYIEGLEEATAQR